MKETTDPSSPIFIIEESGTTAEAAEAPLHDAIPPVPFNQLTPELIASVDKLDQYYNSSASDHEFTEQILGATVNGTTYHGLRARTTGAPQNHWFGPCGDPRGAGIGTPGAILHTWSHHREIVTDAGPVPQGWKVPHPA